jgi:micrococcal nuclease
MLWLTLVAASGLAGLQVVDGDTLRLGDERIRLAGIDTPELNGTCATERQAARAARAALRDLTQNPAQLRLERLGQDKFGRTRATLWVGEVNVAEALIRQRHGVRVTGKRAANWCALLAPKLLPQR